MSKFKNGDKVIFNNKSNWRYRSIKNGDEYKIVNQDVCIDKNVYYVKKDNTYVFESIFEEDLEKFIEPKFKVGQKVVVVDRETNNPEVLEIIVLKLNKKLKTYVNLLFSKQDGRILALTDEDLFNAINFANEKFGKKKMKLSDVEKLLGYKIEIIK